MNNPNRYMGFHVGLQTTYERITYKKAAPTTPKVEGPTYTHEKAGVIRAETSKWVQENKIGPVDDADVDAFLETLTPYEG